LLTNSAQLSIGSPQRQGIGCPQAQQSAQRSFRFITSALLMSVFLPFHDRRQHQRFRDLCVAGLSLLGSLSSVKLLFCQNISYPFFCLDYLWIVALVFPQPDSFLDPRSHRGGRGTVTTQQNERPFVLLRPAHAASRISQLVTFPHDSLLPQNQVHDPAAPYMLCGLTAVPQDAFVRAADFLQRISQHRHHAEVAAVVHLPGHLRDEAVMPGKPGGNTRRGSRIMLMQLPPANCER
jgi:hypothetical protein